MLFTNDELKEELGDWVRMIPYSVLNKALTKVEAFSPNMAEVYPSKKDVFKAFNYCQFQDLKVVILAQDPYHTPHVANGLN